ncbi:uncharacterized protein LOC115691923 [Syzygium oleosum]|uniref:uncharacterized protein LOC115691923 n=1 Tax=Syzygium oleosum TaxID=219896 RepID=UPI0011D24036|nr:uncharacterized protein LOC115691923 [Syzygium oleosum]
MTGMEVEEVVVVGAMVHIEMVIDLAGAIGIVVLEEVQVMTSIIGTLLVSMNVVVKETSVWCRKNTPDSRAIGGAAVTCRRCQSLFCWISPSWFSGWTNLLVRSFDVRTLTKRFNCLMSVNSRFDVFFR